MKIIPILLLLFASFVRPQTPVGDAYEAAHPGMSFAVHSVFIKCYANHFKGSETSTIKDSEDKVRMTCYGFWDKFVAASKNPGSADYLSSPFELIEAEPNHSGVFGIPFSVWNGYLSDTLAISADNPLRKHK